ncbi:MAG: HEAT repeat domain-containing protein [Parachlamydiaceae bacterium]|nr:HEAT repeat domain-containing protein [Parachlamydiaceae bacterium]
MQHIPKALYSNFDNRYNLNQLEDLDLSSDFIATIKAQAQSVACLVHKHFLKKREGGWQFSDDLPTLVQQQEQNPEFQDVQFGEGEAFRNEYAAGFGTAFLVGKQLALTAAHCVCQMDSGELNTRLIQATRLVFGFHDVKKNRYDYFFKENQVFKVTVIAHQYFRLRGKNTGFSEWTDWALLKLDKEVSYPPLPLNLTEKISNNIELYMLGHPNGLPLKLTYNGRVRGNAEADFFDCDLDAFAGNSGSFVANKSTHEVEGILCDGTKDYEITQDYRGSGKIRIQACRITKSMIAQNKIGQRLENCQRMHVLRHLLDESLLGLEGVERPINASQLIIQSLKTCYKGRNTIPRLLGEALPIAEIYTELVLLHNNKEEDKKEEKKAFEEHRINSWEDIHASKKPIELNALFKTQEGKTPNRLIILGRAGIGKSTLCQHIAHQWAEDKLWREKFHALFWIPLRKLQNIHSAETVASFLFRTCCQEKDQKLYVKDIADYLKHNAERVLFVLDGLDEIAFEKNSLQKKIVDELLQFPHWIITSRPHAAHRVQADATIENVGFATKTINFYIQKSFPSSAQALIQKIRQNPIVFGLCHIPINLELVCSILKKSRGDISLIRSMTGLYEELTLILQKRFLEKIGRPEVWEYTQGDLKRDSQINQIFNLLESIAWTGMQQRQLYFSFNHGKMEEIYYSYPPTEERTELFTQACTASGFLLSTGDSEQFLHNEYSFLHLTFQEFFAARYLVRLLQDKAFEAVKCIKAVKFDPRYKVVMWFVAGLLRNEGGDFENLNEFFEILDSPKDHVGFYSTLLKVHCLEECGWQSRLKKIESYKQAIEFWREKITFKPWLDPMIKHVMETCEISPQGAKQFLIPKFNCFLSTKNEDVKKNIIKTLGQIGQTDPQLILPLLINTLKNNNYLNLRLRKDIAKALGQIGQAHPDAAIPLLMHVFKDANDKDEQAAIEIKALDPLDDYLNPRPWISEAAIIALGQIGQTHLESILPFIAGIFKNNNFAVTEAAIKALGQIGQIHPKAVMPLLGDILKNYNYDVKKVIAKAIDPRGCPFSESMIHNNLKNYIRTVKEMTVDTLTKIGQFHPEAVISLLANAFKEADLDIKKAVISAFDHLSQICPGPIIPLLIDAFKDERIRENVVKTLDRLSQTYPETIIPLLTDALKDANDQVRRAAVDVFYRLSQTYPESIVPFPLLANSIKDRDSQVRKTALQTLGQLAKTHPESIVSFIPLLKVALKDKDTFVGEQAAKTLGKLGQIHPKHIIPLLADALQYEDWTKKGAAEALCLIGKNHPESITLLIPLLTNILKDMYMTKTLTKALAQLNPTYPEVFLPLLVNALQKGNYESCQAIAKALCQICQTYLEPVIYLLTYALKDENDSFKRAAVTKALGSIGQTFPQATLPLLADLLKDKDTLVRKAAAEAFGKIGQTHPKSAIPWLSAAIKDKEGQVRVTAAEALGKIIQIDPESIIPLFEHAHEDGFWHVMRSAAYALKTCDLSSHLKSNPNLLHNFYKSFETLLPTFESCLLNSTPLSALIACHKEDPNQSIYVLAITVKCIQENQAIFQQDDCLCFYEQGKFCKIQFQKVKESLLQIENLAKEYPEFLKSPQKIEAISSKDQTKPIIKIDDSQSSTCLIQ